MRGGGGGEVEILRGAPKFLDTRKGAVKKIVGPGAGGGAPKFC